MSHKEDKKTDPLSYDQKLKYFRAAGYGDVVIESPIRTVTEALKYVYQQGYTELYFAGGSDRQKGPDNT